MRKLSISTLLWLDGVVHDPAGLPETEDGGRAGTYVNGEAARLEH